MQFKIINKAIILLVASLLLSGCDNRSYNENVAQKEDYKTEYIDFNSDINIRKLKSVEKLPMEVQAHLSIQPTFHNYYLFDTEIRDGYNFTKTVYSLDIKNDKVKKLKEFGDTFIISFVEYENSFVYGELDGNTLKVIQEKDGKKKELAKATIFDRFQFAPYFFVDDGKLLFLLTDTKQAENGRDAHVTQTLYSYDDEKTESLFQTDFEIKDGVTDENAEHLFSNRFHIQGDGNLAFLSSDSHKSYLYQYDGVKLRNIEVNNPNVDLLGYLDTYAILFDYKDSKYFVLNTENKELEEFNLSMPIYYEQILNKTSLFFNDNKDKLWCLSVDKEGNLKLHELDKKIYDALGLKDAEDHTNFVFSDGDHLVLTQQLPEKEYIYAYYILKFE